MATEPGMTPQGRPVRANGGHEQTDAHANGVFAVLIGLAVAIVIIHFVLSGFIGHLNKKPASTDVWQMKQHGNAATFGSGQPPLQVSPPADLDEFRAREESELNSYTWVNRTSGIVRIPIDRAMDLMVQKGMPSGTARPGPSTLELQQLRPQHT